jgi:hypothetical protein
MWLRTAQDYVLNFCGVKLGCFFENGLNAVRREIFRPRHVEGTAK